MEYNTLHGITPKTIISKVKDLAGWLGKKKDSFDFETSEEKVAARLKRLELEMDVASANLDFERAAEIRDELFALKKRR
jgi:excinuclease ABC subunit B